MASKTQSTNVAQQKKVYVKSENAFKQMQANGQLEPYTDYYTPDDSDAVFMPVGAIFSSAIPQTDARVHILDGSTISQTGMYAEFATLLKTLVSSGYAISCTQAQFNSDVSNYGQCGKFVIDNNAGTIRLPKITKFVEGLTSLANIGKSFSAGLPNITGQHYEITSKTYEIQTSGAFYQSGTGTPSYQNHSAGSEAYPIISFDASRSSSIYGRSSTVQPQSTAYPYYIVLAGGYKSAEQVDIDKVASDLALVKTRYVTQTYRSGSTWYTVYNDGWKECGLLKSNSTQGQIEIALPIAFSTTNYTTLLQMRGGVFNNTGYPNGTNLAQVTGLIYAQESQKIYIQSFGRDYYVYCCGY